MAGFLTSSQIATVTGALNWHFTTFTSGPEYRTITVNREPLRVLSDTGVSPLAGYNNYSLESNYIYIPQNQTFPAIVIYQKEQTVKTFSEMKAPINQGKLFIKVQKDAADYILGAKVESINLDGKKFNVFTSEGVQNYLGLVYYKFGLMFTD